MARRSSLERGKTLALRRFGVPQFPQERSLPRIFGASKNLAIAVRFGGTLATRVKRLDDAALEVDVPAGARTDNLSVLVDGIESKSSSLFPVIKTLLFGRIPLDFLTRATASVVVDSFDSSAKLTLRVASGEASANLPVTIWPRPVSVQVLPSEGSAQCAVC